MRLTRIVGILDLICLILLSIMLIFISINPQMLYFIILPSLIGLFVFVYIMPIMFVFLGMISAFLEVPILKEEADLHNIGATILISFQIFFNLIFLITPNFLILLSSRTKNARSPLRCSISYFSG